MTTRPGAFVPSVGAKMTIALVFGLTVMVFAYSTIRIADVFLFPEPNPAVVVWTDRSRFVWRILIAAYLGGASIFGGYSLANRTPNCGLVWLERSIFVAVVSLLGQAIFAP
jgi:hypothetical protein